MSWPEPVGLLVYQFLSGWNLDMGIVSHPTQTSSNDLKGNIEVVFFNYYVCEYKEKHISWSLVVSTTVRKMYLDPLCTNWKWLINNTIISQN